MSELPTTRPERIRTRQRRCLPFATVPICEKMTCKRRCPRRSTVDGPDSQLHMVREEHMTKGRIVGALCLALMALAALTGEAPRLIRAQELRPDQKVPRPLPLAGTKWMMLESAGQRMTQDGRQPYFELKALERQEDGSAGQLVDATDSCGNRLRGVYRTTGNWLHVRIMSSTLLACKPSKRMPRGLIATLSGDQQFRIRGAELDLLDNSGEVTARFTAAGREAGTGLP